MVKRAWVLLDISSRTGETNAQSRVGANLAVSSERPGFVNRNKKTLIYLGAVLPFPILPVSTFLLLSRRPQMTGIASSVGRHL